jgi:electron transport complex protein RnfD
VFLLIAFPGPLTRWAVPRGTGAELFGQPVTAYDASGALAQLGSEAVDTITAATPLGLLAEKGAHAVAALSGGSEIFFGQMNGSLGETSGLLLLLGGAFLLVRRIISWHIPVSFIGSVAVFAALTHAVSPEQYAGAVFHVFTGGVMLGAWFMATDYVTSPMFPVGKLIFGVGCGVLTMIIRLWAGYPEGVSFAVLLMNAAVPIIDRYTRPRKFGLRRLAEAKGGGDA